jgi:hypothetical protein
MSLSCRSFCHQLLARLSIDALGNAKIKQTFIAAAALHTYFSDDRSYLSRFSACAKSSATGGTRCAHVALYSDIFSQNKFRSNAGKAHVKFANHIPCTTTVAKPYTWQSDKLAVRTESRWNWLVWEGLHGVNHTSLWAALWRDGRETRYCKVFMIKL